LLPAGLEARAAITEEPEVELKVFDRNQTPSSLRAQGYLPAVVYGQGVNRSVYVERKAFDKLFRQVSTHGVITLAFDNGERVDTLVKAVSMDKRRRVAQHADFYAVSDEPVEVPVPVHFTGTARGVREEQGVLDVVLHNVTIKAPPKRIPNELVFDVTNLGLNEPLHVRDLQLPAGVTLVTDGDLTVLTVHPPRVEEPATPSAAAEPEVIARGKADEE
jgi:large subunit ribosomal protein L25